MFISISLQDHDSYRAFRSSSLDLSLTFDVAAGAGNGDTGDRLPHVLLYANTFRCLEFLIVSLMPIRLWDLLGGVWGYYPWSLQTTLYSENCYCRAIQLEEVVAAAIVFLPPFSLSWFFHQTFPEFQIKFWSQGRVFLVCDGGSLWYSRDFWRSFFEHGIDWNYSS